MSNAVEQDFPLFPLGIVALPSEYVPLHVFEERFKTMIEMCLEQEREFGIVWLTDEELKPIGCACRVERVLERMEDGRLNILARGTRPFRLLERNGELDFPAGKVEFVDDEIEGEPDEAAALATRNAYAELVEEATDSGPDLEELKTMTAYEMAATVAFGLDAKQGLLELRSESARMRLVGQLLRAARKRLEFADRAQARARSNGKVHFG